MIMALLRAKLDAQKSSHAAGAERPPSDRPARAGSSFPISEALRNNLKQRRDR
jgi:hypothetical protein